MLPAQIYYINLDRRPDRAALMTQQLDSTGIPYERIPAVDGRLWDGTGWKARGRASESYWRGSAGCYFSHIRAAERALEVGRFPALILEDDAEIIGPLTLPDDGQLIRLGGLDRVDRVYGCHATAFKTRECLAAWLQYLRTHRNTADSVLIAFSKTIPTAYVRPWSIIQGSGYSDILNREIQQE